MKKVHGSILIYDELFVTAAIFTAVIDVFLGIEMADTGTHRIKIANLCRFCGYSLVITRGRVGLLLSSFASQRPVDRHIELYTVPTK